jgi:hypothetical protein
VIECRNLFFWLETADLRIHCTLGHCSGVESNHFTTAMAPFFKLFLTILTEIQCNISDSWFDHMWHTQP